MLTEVLSPIALELADGETKLTGLQLMPLGVWDHPRGKIAMTVDRARSFAEGFRRQVAGQRLPVLYIHSDKSNVAHPMYGKAAGWITDMRADEQRGLLIDVDFTKPGAQVVRNKEFSYLSAEYFDKVQLPHHDRPHQDVMVGAALVNRPHLKGMNPILNEETGHQFFYEVQADEGGGPVDPILLQLCEAAGIEIAKDATELTDDQRESITTYLTEQATASKTVADERDSLKKQLADLEDPESAKVRSLAEAGFAEEATLLAELAAERELTQLEGMLPDGHIYTKPTKEKLAEYSQDRDPVKLREAFELVVSGKGTADTRELGSSGGTKDDDTDSGSEFNLEVAKLMREDKELSIAEAMDRVIETKPSLYEAHELQMRGGAALVGGGA